MYPFVLAAMLDTPPRERPSLRVLDFPAGDGVLSFALAASGFRVEAADLFPEYFADGLERARSSGLGAASLFERTTGASLPRWLSDAMAPEPGVDPRVLPVPLDIRCVPADMEGECPLPAGSFDRVVCVEGIEHVVDRHATLNLLRSLLAPGGRLMLTTPNLLSLRSRAAFALAGQRAFKSYIDEYTSVWGRSPDGSRTYHGHAFLLNYFQLRYSLHHCGFRIRRLWPSNWSPSSLLMSPVIPLVWAATAYSQRRAKRRFVSYQRSGLAPEDADPPYREMMRHLLSPSMLFNATLIVEAEAVARSA